MKKMLILLSAVFFATFLAPVSAASNTVLISEVQTGGTSASDEFIELVNASNRAQSGFSIKYLSSTGSKPISLITDTGSIGPGEYKVFTKKTSGSSLGLASAGGHVLLYSGATLLDKVGWGTAKSAEAGPASAPSAGSSIVRSAAVDTDNNSVDFKVSDTPTPGLINKFSLAKVSTATTSDTSNTTNTSKQTGAPITASSNIAVAQSSNVNPRLAGYALVLAAIITVALSALYYKKGFLNNWIKPNAVEERETDT